MSLAISTLVVEQHQNRAALQRASLPSTSGFFLRGNQRKGKEVVPPIVHNELRAPGQPLDPSTRAFMEPRFGHDFSRVRVHSNTRAADSALAVNALAYTVGRDIVFGAGQYTPGTTAGQRLIAHELAHVVQQNFSTPSTPTLEIGPTDDHYEKMASETAARLAQPGWWPSPGLTVAPRLQCQPGPASPAATTFSVDQAAYLDMISQALQLFSEPIVAGNTLSDPIQPILQAMLAQATWRDQTGADHGGAVIPYPLPGTPRVMLSLRLILDDQVDPPDAGKFIHTGATNGTLIVRVRSNTTVDDLALTLYHEGMHMAAWLINRPGPPRVTSPVPQAVRGLTLSRFPVQIASLREQLGRLAQGVNRRRQTAGQPVITTSQLDRMAPWLMEEVLVRAETEVFRLASQVQRQRGTRGPRVFIATSENTEINLRMVGRYIFEFNSVFQPADRNGIAEDEQAILRRITEMLEGFFQLQVRRRFSITPYTISAPPPDIHYTPPPLTRPPLGPLPLPRD